MCQKIAEQRGENSHSHKQRWGHDACPQQTTEDGNELQIQTNHLGHFLFTLLLLPKIRKSGPGCRIINVSSVGHKCGFAKFGNFLRNWSINLSILAVGSIHLENLNLEKSYGAIKAYTQSKLANVLFSSELARKLNGIKF